MPSLLPKLPPRGEKATEFPGPPANGYTFLPWLFMGTGAALEVAKGKVAHPWLGGLGILAFAVLYAVVAFRAFDKRRREERASLVLLGALAAVTYALGIGYGGLWLLFFPLLSLACGAVLRDKRLGVVIITLAGSVGVISGFKTGDPWANMTIAYGTFLSGMVIAALLSLSETVRELRDTRQELARTAVEKERLRFSRDLHDLLGHTLSVIVVKSEAARRIARRDLDAALGQVADIESVGRQALTEIREAVTGYREGSLATELDRARSALSAAEVEPVVRQSGPPLPAQAEALLGWVVREAVTNVVRHSAATRCEIAVEGTPERVTLTITDNGRGAPTAPAPTPRIGGTGLKGLTERLAAASGSLTAGPAPRTGFRVTAELPVDPADTALDAELTTGPAGH
ncbi:sensor histidine kinase [Streptomyces sp. ASQP_92]|uniref:sensor histidine kinase n=1 Tax=Streptomyces sp. ASQP_92 TaxID=2979116 RepID=UPI0021BEED37|nr:sensor histidine kinase [Streptomyces sp. ASQP_92]MCT9087926.1 sensor histidine kinase [Streptomyces sp. ASQP_92]